MLYNKNKFRKTNDQKLLRKKGKRWIVMSTALLAMIGGGMALSHTSHADTVNANSSNQPNTMQVLNDQSADNSDNSTTNAQQTPLAQSQQNTQTTVNTVNDNAQSNQQQSSTNQSQTAPAVQQNSNVQPSVNQQRQQTTQTAPQASATQSASTGKGSLANNVAPSVNNTSASNTTQSSASDKKDVQTNITGKANIPSLPHNNLHKNGLLNNAKKLDGVKGLKNAHLTSAINHHLDSNARKTNDVAYTHNSTSASTYKSRRTSLLTSIGSSANANARIHLTNGVPQVDGNAVVAAPTIDGGNNNTNDRRNLGAIDGNASDSKKVQANGHNNNEDKDADPFESDPYNPIINVDFADVTKYDMPVGDSDTVQAHSNDQLTISKNGSVTINGQQIQAPKGYTVAPYTDDTYTTGTYTILPRMFDKKTSTWSSEDFTVGVKPVSATHSNVGTNLGNADNTTASAANPSSSLLGSPNNVTASTGNDGGNGGANNNNNITPNGTMVNNNDRGNGSNYVYSDDHDDEFAALINNQDRDGQDMLNRMQASGENATSVMASEAADQASVSAQAVSVSEEGQDAATIQSMNNSSEAQSLKNEIAEQSSESTLQSSYDNDMDQFRNGMNDQRANLNSADVNALDQLSQLTNLTTDQDNQVADQLQSAESDYLGQLAQAENPTQWSAVNNDYLASLSRIISNAQSVNDSNRSNSTNSTDNDINGDTTEINSLVDSNQLLTNGQRNSLKNKFASEAANATAMVSSNTTNSDVMTSIVNSLNADVTALTAEGSANATSDSNVARSASDARQASENANVIAHRDSAINEIEQDPTLTQGMKSMYVSQVMDEAAKFLNSHASMSTSANGSIMNNANPIMNNSNQETQSISFGNSLPNAQMVGVNSINATDSNDKAFVLNNTAISDPVKPVMSANLDRLANNGIDLVREANNIPAIANDVAMVNDNMNRYAGNITFGNGFAQNELKNVTTVPDAQAIGVMDLSNTDDNDKSYVSANSALSPVQQTAMNRNLDQLADEGISDIHNASSISDVEQILSTAQNQMARYSGNLRNYNYNRSSLTEYPTQYDAPQKTYTHGLQHFDAAEYQGEASLVGQYHDALMHGYNFMQTPTLNEQAFSYGVKDATDGLEAYPGIKNIPAYQAGHTAYTSGFNDGRQNRHADLSGYSLLYQNTYDAAYKDGHSYQAKNNLVRTKAYNFGYNNSRAHRLAVGNVYGHSAEYVRGYINGLNDRLGHHPIYLILNRNAMLHYSPKFSNKNAITMLKGGRRSSADEVIVNGASVDRNGNIRYHVIGLGAGSYVRRRINGWISANHHVVHDTYYRANGVRSHTNKVRALRGTYFYSKRNWTSSNIIGRIHKGETIRIRGIVHCDSITRFYVRPGVYFTANKNYVQWLRN